MRVAIIGAGMAGLTAARDLKRAGADVQLFDKGRGPGGRMSTRRAEVDGQTLRFDHGAQYISPKSEAFAAEIERWVEAGAAAEWTGRLVHIDEAGHVTEREATPAYVGTPGMNEIIRYLSSEQNVHWGKRVSRVTKHKSWSLSFEDGEIQDGYDCVVIAVPAEQVSDLLGDIGRDIARAAKGVSSDPCWTVMAAFAAPLDIAWDGAVIDKNSISWTARNSSKPGRGKVETWILQASAEWSRQNLEDEKELIAERLMQAFSSLSSGAEAMFTSAHRWRYSQVRPEKHARFYFDKTLGLGACGDWCSGPKVEDAWESGRALAEAMG
ncbi:MAG: FAD-dependent oxidoreductase [Pseudomonadota bacterium]